MNCLCVQLNTKIYIPIMMSLKQWLDDDSSHGDWLHLNVYQLWAFSLTYFFFIHSSRCLVVVFRATVSIKLSSLFFAYSGCILKNSLTSSKLGKSEGAEHMKRNYRTKRSSAFFLLFQCLYIHTYVLQTYRRHADIQKDRQADINTHTHAHI